MKIAFYGSSLLSSYWNGAATYYRGILRALAYRGYQITFFEPDAYDRQKHRDIEDPEWARIVVYNAGDSAQVEHYLAQSSSADVVVKASGVGVLDEFLERRVAAIPVSVCKVFWDVDAPATLAELGRSPDHPLHRALPSLDIVLTYGGGPPVVRDYEAFGAHACVPIYNALDPSTHFPVAPEPRFEADLAFLGNRLPDREVRVDAFFLDPAARLPERSFLIGGSGWESKAMPPNVGALGHLGTGDHNAFNATPLAVLNVARDSMAANGFSPATRVFEAAGAAACIITDAWKGIELFLTPGTEVLVARDGADIVDHMSALTRERAQAIGAAARARILSEHTYAHRGAEVDKILRSLFSQKRERRLA